MCKECMEATNPSEEQLKDVIDKKQTLYCIHEYDRAKKENPKKKPKARHT